MSTLDFIIWNGNPELFSFESPVGYISLRWYGLLFALGFLVSQQILYYIHKKEGKPESDVEILTIYMIVATIIGARLGHVLFYQPEMLWQDPLGVILPFEFTPEFRFTGLKGLASHGGAIGILFALWLYARKKKPGQNYLQVLDRIVILVALTGALIRFGNYFNSEILGKPTTLPTGVVFFSQAHASVLGDPTRSNNPVEVVTVKKNPGAADTIPGMKPIRIFVLFKAGFPEQEVRFFIDGEIQQRLFYAPESVLRPTGMGLFFKTILDERSNQIMAQIDTLGVTRHPAQLYEAISCLLLFMLLFYIWNKHKQHLPEGRIFGLFMIILWSLRFGYEFLKENQVAFEDKLPLNMGQILSIPLVIIGVVILIRSYKRPQPGA
ncbi:MAG: prolipoprotein diacylglyceryl transferase [Cytophagales bacterium]|nr:prolipoprotein diacylglyceryl transferase [Cytophagales bacterium]